MRVWMLTATAGVLAVSLVAATQVSAENFDRRKRAIIQEALIWAGDYDGMVDGKFGKGTIAAIRNFQSANGYRADGELTDPQAAQLTRAAEKVQRRFGYVVIADKRAGVSLGLPTALVTQQQSTPDGNRYSSPDGAIEIDTMAISESKVSFSQLYRRIHSNGPIRNVSYSMKRDEKFVVSGDDGAKHHYFMAVRSNGTIRAMSVSFAFGLDLRAITVAAANSFHIGYDGAPFPAEPATQMVIAVPNSPSATSNVFVERTRLLQVVDRFLSDAGIDAYKVLSPEQGDRDPHLRWVYEDGSGGELLAVRPGFDVKVEDLANTAITREAKACKGEFASARQRPRYFKGSEILRVETRCRAQASLNAVNFSIIELSSGVILRFGSHVSAEASDALMERSTRVEDAAIAHAATNGLQ